MPQNFFITGTDTDVGKTLVTALYAAHYVHQGLKVFVYKPVQTGVSCFQESDPAQIQRWLPHPNLRVQCSYIFPEPAAPLTADLKREIRLERILEDYQSACEQADIVLVEGAGGLMVPVMPELLIADLIKRMNLPCALVTRPNLGTINHTLLSLNYLRQESIPVQALIVNEARKLSEEERDSLAVTKLLESWQGFLPEGLKTCCLSYRHLEPAELLTPEHPQLLRLRNYVN